MNDLLLLLAQGLKPTEQNIREGIHDIEDTDLVLMIARGEKITDKDLYNEFYNICDRVHSGCNNECPVYKLNGGKAVGEDKDFEENRGCDCFKNGKEMLKFVKKQLK